MTVTTPTRGAWHRDGDTAVYRPGRWRYAWSPLWAVYAVVAFLGSLIAFGDVLGLWPGARPLSDRNLATATANAASFTIGATTVVYWIPAVTVGLLALTAGANTTGLLAAAVIGLTFSLPFTVSRVRLEHDYADLVHRTHPRSTPPAAD